MDDFINPSSKSSQLAVCVKDLYRLAPKNFESGKKFNFNIYKLGLLKPRFSKNTIHSISPLKSPKVEEIHSQIRYTKTSENVSLRLMKKIDMYQAANPPRNAQKTNPKLSARKSFYNELMQGNRGFVIKSEYKDIKIEELLPKNNNRSRGLLSNNTSFRIRNQKQILYLEIPKAEHD